MGRPTCVPVFVVLALGAAGLVACGGGGGSARPTAPTPAPAYGPVLADGATATYAVTESNGLTGSSAYVGTYSETDTVTANQSFNGQTGLFKIERVQTQPTGGGVTPYSTYSYAIDTYVTTVASAGGVQLVSVGDVETSNVVMSTGFAFSEQYTATTTHQPPNVLEVYPNTVGTAFGDPEAYVRTISETTTYPGSASSSTFSSGPSSFTGVTTVSLTAAGAFHEDQKIAYVEGGSSEMVEDLSPALAGSMTVSGSGSTPSVVTVGAPELQNGTYVIPYTSTASVATGQPTPAPTATTLPLWYPDGPGAKFLIAQVIERGVQSLPAACAVPAGTPTSGEESDLTIVTVDPVWFSAGTDVQKQWNAPGYGTLCSTDVFSTTQYDSSSGAVEGTSEDETTAVLVSMHVPTSASRRAQSAMPTYGVILPFHDRASLNRRLRKMRTAMLGRRRVPLR